MSSSSVYTFAIYQYGFPAMPRGFTFCVPIRDRHAPVAPFSPGRRIYFSGIDPELPQLTGRLPPVNWGRKQYEYHAMPVPYTTDPASYP
jgi:hypothetical protein